MSPNNNNNQSSIIATSSITTVFELLIQFFFDSPENTDLRLLLAGLAPILAGIIAYLGNLILSSATLSPEVSRQVNLVNKAIKETKAELNDKTLTETMRTSLENELIRCRQAKNKLYTDAAGIKNDGKKDK